VYVVKEGNVAYIVDRGNVHAFSECVADAKLSCYHFARLLVGEKKAASVLDAIGSIPRDPITAGEVLALFEVAYSGMENAPMEVLVRIAKAVAAKNTGMPEFAHVFNPTQSPVAYLAVGSRIYELKLKESGTITFGGEVHKNLEYNLRKQLERIAIELDSLQCLKAATRRSAEMAGTKEILEVLQNWSADKRHPGWIRYAHKIVPVMIKCEGKVVLIPEEHRDKFYIQGLRIDARKDRLNARVSRARHPNVSPARQVCLGDLASAPISEFMKVPEMLRMINLDSAYGGKAKNEAEELFFSGIARQKVAVIDAKEEGEYIGGEEVISAIDGGI